MSLLAPPALWPRLLRHGSARERMNFAERLRAAGLSPWELGDLLGIHPHQLRGHPGPRPGDRTITVLIELARRLDMHPADLVPEFDDVLGNRRRTPIDVPATEAGDEAGDETGDEDAMVVLTALAAAAPFTLDALADALAWPLPRAQAALDHAHAHPRLTGPYALRRVPPDAYLLQPRLDVLTADQHRAVAGAARHHRTLDEYEAAILAAAIIATWRTAPIDWPALRSDELCERVITALRTAGIIFSDRGPYGIQAHEDVLYSLRYRDDTLLAAERDETIPANPYGTLWPDPVHINPDGTVIDDRRPSH